MHYCRLGDRKDIWPVKNLAPAIPKMFFFGRHSGDPANLGWSPEKCTHSEENVAVVKELT